MRITDGAQIPPKGLDLPYDKSDASEMATDDFGENCEQISREEQLADCEQHNVVS
jgi:hypothetical protein